MKFVIRRAVVGLIGIPIVATAYVLFCAFLIGLGAGISFGVDTAWANGFMLGSVVAVWFTFITQIDALFQKWGL